MIEASADIAAGDAVYVTGYSGGLRTMAPASAATEAQARGELLFAKYAIASGVQANVYTWLLLTEQDTSALALSQTIYLSTGGDWSATAGTLSRAIGQVLTVSATSGVVLVSSTGGVGTSPGVWVTITDLATDVTGSAGGTGDWTKLAYRDNNDGTVSFKGACYIGAGTSGNALFTMPAALRPLSDIEMVVMRLTGASAYSMQSVALFSAGQVGKPGRCDASSASIANGDSWVFSGVQRYPLV